MYPMPGFDQSYTPEAQKPVWRSELGENVGDQQLLQGPGQFLFYVVGGEQG